jgi:hypothetical protein
MRGTNFQCRSSPPAPTGTLVDAKISRLALFCAALQSAMDRPRLIRGLRIAWNVWWGIVCVLLVVLWVRSYSQVALVLCKFGNGALTVVQSWPGGIVLAGAQGRWNRGTSSGRRQRNGSNAEAQDSSSEPGEASW